MNVVSSHSSTQACVLLTWLKCGSNNAIDLNTTIILFLLSFSGMTTKDTWILTMSPIRNMCGATGSMLGIQFISVFVSVDMLK
jgi:hypothetical protein